MKSPVRFLMAVMVATASMSAFADPRIPVAQDPDRASRVSAAQQERMLMLTRRAEGAAPKAVEAINSATPSLPTPNPLRAYPPSCLADPLPDVPSGPLFSTTANLAAYNSNDGTYELEGVTITIWRVACSSAIFFNSATLMRIQRQGQYEGDRVIYPLFPVIAIEQSTNGFDEIPRLALDPNTVVSDVLPDSPIIDSTTYVLENYAGAGANYFDYNLPFSVQFDNLFPSDNLFYIDNIPAYNPSNLTYPAAFQNLPISGYLATAYYDPTASGEGIVMQVFQRPGEPNTFVLNFTWSAYDPSGLPFWLTGQVDIVRGAKVATTPMAYVTGGGLGGDAGAADPPTIWGTATVSFPDCNHMNLSYASNPGLPAFVPQGSGSRSWIRLATLNGLPCE
ncbi:hypothetical protein [Dokdonella sp.]|uniref:hypothetical protein n=1 Tax=Dokdonella sp. TaxID=2291710 RepID=UPI003529590C